jgi:integrase
MSKAHRTARGAADKPARPAKPHPDFPLFPHAAGYWAKKIRGKFHYFGPWDDPDGALKKYLEQKDALHAGRKPRADPDSVTVKDVANAFLNHKQALLDAGEVAQRTWKEYKETTDLVVARFGKSRLVEDLGPDDFAELRKHMAKRWGPTRLGNAIQRVRSVFRHAGPDGAKLIPTHVCFGPGFRRPSKKVLRLHRAKAGAKLFTAEEIRRMIGTASVSLKALILLGINAGFGIADCGQVPLTALDLDGGWVTFPRPKTGIPRRCCLWPETVAALREVLAVRPKPKDPSLAGLALLTAHGTPWYAGKPGGPAVYKMTVLMRKCGVNGRKGLGFYTLRHVFRTVADEAKDQPAVDHIMGHEIPHMSSVYRETISDARLRAVADHVRAWLFPPPKKDKAEPKEPAATAEVATEPQPRE